MCTRHLCLYTSVCKETPGTIVELLRHTHTQKGSMIQQLKVKQQRDRRTYHQEAGDWERGSEGVRENGCERPATRRDLSSSASPP